MPSAPPARVTAMIELSTVAGRSSGLLSLAVGLEADAIDGAIDLRHAEDLLDLLGERGVFAQIDGFAAEAARPARSRSAVHVADNDHGRSQQMARGGAGQPHGAGPRHVDGRPGAHAGRDRAVVAGREDVGEQRQVLDLGHGLVAVGELQQVEVGVGDHHVLGLSADPSAHVHVAVGGAGAGGLTFRQMPGLASLQFRQRPQAMLKGTETMSPFSINSTSRPVSMTSPVISWPSTSPAGAVVRPRTMCWSDPQILVEMIFRITPCSIFLPLVASASWGKSIDSTCTSPGFI